MLDRLTSLLMLPRDGPAFPLRLDKLTMLQERVSGLNDIAQEGMASRSGQLWSQGSLAWHLLVPAVPWLISFHVDVIKQYNQEQPKEESICFGLVFQRES